MLKPLTMLIFVATTGAASAEEQAAQITFESCAVCHGEGEGAAAIPAIRGQSYEKLRAGLEGFAAGNGDPTIMHRFAVALSEDDIEDLTRYIADLGGATP